MPILIRRGHGVSVEEALREIDAAEQGERLRIRHQAAAMEQEARWDLQQRLDAIEHEEIENYAALMKRFDQERGLQRARAVREQMLKPEANDGQPG